jgi:hypothetical protein
MEHYEALSLPPGFAAVASLTFDWNIAFLLTRMASGVQAQGVLAAAQSINSVEVGC